MKQKIADGIMKWLRDEAPSSFKVAMTANDVRNLTQAICDEFEAEDFKKIGEADSADGVVESVPVKMNDMQIGTLRKGSTVAYWSPAGVVVGIIETNPEHPPRVHYFDGRGTVELDEAATRSKNEHMGETGQL